MCLVEDSDFEEGHITVKNKENETLVYRVSDECKILVAGQTFIIYLTLDEWKYFMDSINQDDDNKVILIVKDYLVEQIKMYGHDNWK